MERDTLKTSLGTRSTQLYVSFQPLYKKPWLPGRQFRFSYKQQGKGKKKKKTMVQIIGF